MLKNSLYFLLRELLFSVLVRKVDPSKFVYLTYGCTFGIQKRTIWSIDILFLITEFKESTNWLLHKYTMNLIYYKINLQQNFVLSFFQTWISLDQCFGVSFFVLLKVNWRLFRMWCSRGNRRGKSNNNSSRETLNCTELSKVQKCANSKMRNL